MKKLLVAIIIVLPFFAKAQNPLGYKFSGSVTGLTVQKGGYIPMNTIKILKSDGSPAPQGTPVDYQFVGVDPLIYVSSLSGPVLGAGAGGSLSGFGATKAVGSFTLKLTIAQTNVSVNVPVTITAPLAYSIQRISSVSQTAFVNSEFLENTSIRVFLNNAPAANIPVSFLITGAAATATYSANAPTAKTYVGFTDANGYATAGKMVANGTTGTFYINITVGANQVIKFSCTNVPTN